MPRRRRFVDEKPSSSSSSNNKLDLMGRWQQEHHLQSPSKEVGSPSKDKTEESPKMKRPCQPRPVDGHINRQHNSTEVSVRHVSFSPRSKIIHLKRVEDIEDKSLIWFQQDDFKRMKDEALELVRQESSGELRVENGDGCFRTNDDEDTTRGLEFRTKENAESRRANRSLAIEKVMTEQRKQQLCNQVDPDSISRVYEEISRPCQLAAHFFGLQDEEDADMLNFQQLRRWSSLTSASTDLRDHQLPCTSARAGLRRWKSEVFSKSMMSVPCRTTCELTPLHNSFSNHAA